MDCRSGHRRLYIFAFSASCMVSIFASGSLSASDAVQVRDSTPSTPCPNSAKLRNICNLITTRDRDKTRGSNFEYLYEKAIYEASCADYNADGDALIAKKISSMFESNRNRLLCHGVDFDVVEGNILKYAISSRAFGLINSAIEEWRVNLNWIDPDGTTLLDYIGSQIPRTKGTPNERMIKIYYDRVRRAGGRHRHEL